MTISPKGFDFWQYLERLFVILFSANLIDNHSVNASSKFYICYFHRPISSCLHAFLQYSVEGKDRRIKMALQNLAKRYLTLHPTSTNVERLFSTNSDVLDGRNLNTESLEKLVFLKETHKLRNFTLDWCFGC